MASNPPLARRPAAPAVRVLLAAAAAIIVACLPLWLDPALAAASPQLLALNAMPLLLLWLLVWSLCRRPAAAASIIVLLAAALYSANQIKLQHLELPLMPSDLAVAGQLITSIDLFWRYLGEANPLFFLLPLATLLLLMYEPASVTRARLARLTAAVAVLLVLAALPRGGQPWQSMYAQQRLSTTAWLPQEAAAQVGVVAFFIHLAQSTWQGPQQPDPTALATFEAHFGSELEQRLAGAMPDELPDLIILQSESFFDPGRLNGVDASAFLQHYHRISRRSLHGEVQVPTFGGLTTRTEFELLTGIPLAAMPGVQYPYQGLVHRPVHSLPWALKQLGYSSRAVHPYDRRFYRRDKVYPLLGFDSFHAISEFVDEDRHGYFVSDAALVRRVIEIADREGPQLVLAISMENHGPWDNGRPLPVDALAGIEVPDLLDEDEARQLRMFLHHTGRADAALGTLVDWASARERHTMVLFFGDHLPSMPDVFGRLGFADGQPGNRQPLPWLLFDNRQDRTGRENLHSHQLAALLLDIAGINHDRHFAAADLLRTGELDPDMRRELLEELGRERFFVSVEPIASHLQPGLIAAVSDWGPRGAEAVSSGAATSTARFWVEFEQPPPIGTYLSIDGRRLALNRVSDRRIYGSLSPQASEGLFRRPGTLNLQAVEPFGSLIQPIGEIEVRPRAERARLANGRRALRICPADDWGPQISPRDASANLQPNGNLGLWVRANCLPPDGRLAFGEVILDTTIEDQVATASVPTSLLAAGTAIPLRLLDLELDEWISVGAVRITD
jgi:phosphoglycerol transferase MdoB-like AlkP superfamily enzyme